MRRRHLRLALAAALAGCGAPAALRPAGSCGPREVQVVNLSSLAVEQFYLGTGAPGGWGADLLAGRGELPSGGALALRLPPGPAPSALRAVWVNGRAAELGGMDGCAAARITLTDGAVRAE